MTNDIPKRDGTGMYVRTHVWRGISFPVLITVINPRRASAARVTVLVPYVCQSVSLSVTTFSASTRNEGTKWRYEEVCCCNGFILKKKIFVKLPRLKVMV